MAAPPNRVRAEANPVTLLEWLVRIWRCREALCPMTTFTESHDLAPSRMVLTKLNGLSTRGVDFQSI
jgi:hypothetical protein